MALVARDARFWVALVVLVKAVLFYVLPDFPEQVWSAVDGLVVAVLAALVGGDVVEARRAARGY